MDQASHVSSDGGEQPDSTPLQLKKVFLLGAGKMSALCYGQGSNMIHAVSEGKRVTVFDPSRGHLFRSYQLPSEQATCADWLSWGHHLAVGTWRGVEIYDAWTGDCIVKTPQHISIVSKVAWSSSQGLLAISVCAIRLWNTTTESYARLLEGPGGEAALAWNRDGTLLASANSRGTVMIWESQTGRAVHRIQACSTIISSLAWSSDSRYLAIPATTRGWDRDEGINITVFDFKKGEIAAELVAHGALVTALSFHPFGAACKNMLVSRGSGEMRVWRCDSWKCVAIVPEKPSNYVLAPTAFHPHGSELFTSGDDECSVNCWKFDRSLLKLDAPYTPIIDNTPIIDLTPPSVATATTANQALHKCIALLDKVEQARESKEKGRTLEVLCRELFLSVDGFKVDGNVRTETEEIDLSIQQWGRGVAWLERHAFFILAECKNWSGQCGKNEFVIFQQKLLNRRQACNLGFLISWNGFADTVELEALRGSREGCVVALLDGNDLREAAREGNFISILFRGYNHAVMS